MKTITLRIDSKQFEDEDDCLTAACESVREELGLDGTVRLDAEWTEDSSREHIDVAVPASAIYDAIEIGAASPSTTGVDDGLDLDVTVCGIHGEVTLIPSEDGGGFGSWGQRSNWVSGSLLRALDELVVEEDDVRRILAEVASRAGAEADAYEPAA